MGSKTKQFGLLRRRVCPKCHARLPIVNFITDRRLRRLCNHCRKARAEELNALKKWKGKVRTAMWGGDAQAQQAS